MNGIKKDLSLILRGLSKRKLLLGKGYFTMTVVRSVLTLSTPYIAIHMSGKIITALSEKRSFREILGYALIAVFSTLLLDLANRIIGKLIRQNEFMRRPRHDAMLSKKALSLDYAQSESGKISEMRAKIQENSRGGRGGILTLVDYFSELVSAVISAVIAFVMSFGLFTAHSDRPLTGFFAFADSACATMMLCVIIAVLISAAVLSENKSARKRFTIFSRRGRLHATMDYYTEKVLNENKSGKDIRIFNEGGLIFEELKNRVFAPFSKTENETFRVMATFGTVRIAVVAVIGGLVYIFVGIKALAGAFPIGRVVEYYGLITGMFNCVSIIAAQLGLIKTNNEYLAVELEYLELESDMKNGTEKVSEADLQNAEFEFHNVSFRYPGTDKLVINGISLKIRTGERLAVVGLNGSGKSTMIKLLCRLYDPTDGYITVNGTDIRDFDYAEYLKLFSVVFQDFRLLAFSVAENVAANDEYDENRIWSCLDAAGMKERVEAMPKKLNTAIYKLYQKNGIDLSGGEEQKIAIARALYKETPFIVLDEPTAALDPIAESEIYSRFNNMVKDKTAVYISHRLSSCRFCDRILVFDNGRITEEGTHGELTALNGRYSEMWNAQSQYYNI